MQLDNKAVYITAVRWSLADAAGLLLPATASRTHFLSNADIVCVLDVGAWWESPEVLANINAARRARKPWELMSLTTRDLLAPRKTSTTVKRRRVTLPK